MVIVRLLQITYTSSLYRLWSACVFKHCYPACFQDSNTMLVLKQPCLFLLKVVVCACDAAWTGDFCEVDRNGCEDGPCFPGITCVDNIAPLDGNTCGPCPTGLEGNGFKCYGKQPTPKNPMS